MTWALCLNCGEIKFGAICPCPNCQVASTGDMGLDIAFSDHHLSRETLERFGVVVKRIRSASESPELSFWTFMQYISRNHGDILSIELKDELMATRVESVLTQLQLQPVVVERFPHTGGGSRKKWWQFWRRGP